MELVASLVEADNDATLAELREQLWQHTKVQVSRATIGRTLQTLKLTRTKNRGALN